MNGQLELLCEEAILKRARQANERGFKVIFGSDGTATDDPDLHEAELKVLRRGFARVMTTEKSVGHLKRAVQ